MERNATNDDTDEGGKGSHNEARTGSFNRQNRRGRGVGWSDRQCDNVRLAYSRERTQKG